MNLKRKKAHLVFDHQGAFLYEGTIKNIAARYNMKYKSLTTAIYNETSHRDYVIIEKNICKTMSMLQIMNYCRSLDRRWIDVTTGKKPVYKHYQMDCKRLTCAAKRAETIFKDEDLLLAEINYKRHNHVK
jgi:TPP-dependent 2-oxoacid decarboxylase